MNGVIDGRKNSYISEKGEEGAVDKVLGQVVVEAEVNVGIPVNYF